MKTEDEPPHQYNEVTGTQTFQDADKPLHSLIFGPRVLKHFNQPKQRTDITAGRLNMMAYIFAIILFVYFEVSCFVA